MVTDKAVSAHAKKKKPEEIKTILSQKKLILLLLPVIPFYSLRTDQIREFLFKRTMWILYILSLYLPTTEEWFMCLGGEIA